MCKISFHSSSDIPDSLLKFAFIMAKKDGKWIFCRHKERDTFEIPGGHREPGEDIFNTAKRELYEETGAVDFDLTPVCIYSITTDTETAYSMLFLAAVRKLDELPPDMEMAEIIFCGTLPERLTYPLTQPILYNKVVSTEKTLY